MLATKITCLRVCKVSRRGRIESNTIGNLPRIAGNIIEVLRRKTTAMVWIHREYETSKNLNYDHTVDAMCGRKTNGREAHALH